MSQGPQIKLGNAWLTSLTSWSNLRITDRWPYGCWEAAWQLPVEGLRRFTQLAARQHVSIYFGGTRIWTGFMAEPNWETGEMVAIGCVRHGEEALCLVNATSLATTTPDVAITDAYTRGALDWVVRTSTSNASVGDGEATDEVNYVSALMDAYVQKANVGGWGVNAQRELIVAATPTAPSYRVRPESGSLGVADEVMANRVFARYLSTAGAVSLLSVGSGAPELIVDLRDRGLMDGTKATNIATAIYNRLGARTGWTNGVTVAPGDIANMGGSTVSLGSVSAGARGPIMVRLDGLRDERGAATYTDIAISESVWDVDADTLTLNPVGMVARDLASIIEETAGPPVEAGA